MNLFLESTAVILGLCFLYFLMKENIICWFFGIASSLFSIVLFYRTGLYSESILYFYYVIIGIYGYFLWKRNDSQKGELKITRMSLSKLFIWFGIGVVLATCLGYFFDSNTHAQSPYFDASTTIFSFIASYLEAKKIINGWLWWIVINTATVVLYLRLGLEIYTFLTLVYLVFSFVGYYKWRQQLLNYKQL